MRFLIEEVLVQYEYEYEYEYCRSPLNYIQRITQSENHTHQTR